jgi:hypothetical protein
MKAAKLFLLPVFVLCLSFTGRPQNIGIGGDVMYNFQTNGFGAGLRGTFFLNNKFSLSPEFSYYPGFNQVEEYILGAALEYKFIRTTNFNFYAIAHAGYDSWLNYQDSPMLNAHEANWDLEGGIGVTGNKCLRPFMEYRYNTRFQEAHLRIGLLYILGCHGGGSSGGRKEPGTACPTF